MLLLVFVVWFIFFFIIGFGDRTGGEEGMNICADCKKQETGISLCAVCLSKFETKAFGNGLEQGKAEERKQFDDFKRALIKRKGKQYKNLQKEILEPCNDGYGKTLSCELRMEAIKSDLGWIAKQEAKKV